MNAARGNPAPRTLDMTTAVGVRASTVAGGVAWVLATIQYAVVQVVATAAWPTPYSLKDNYISDLGNTACGPFALPHAVPAYICSPDNVAMNVSFVAAGILTTGGAWLLRHWWPPGRLARVAWWLWLVAGLGKIIVGVVPENTNLGLHLLGAFNIPLGSIAILLFAVAIRRSAPVFAAVSAVLGVLGLVGTVLSSAGQYAGPALFLGLGVGGTERLGGYPGNLWVLLVGLLALAAARSDGPAGRADRLPDAL